MMVEDPDDLVDSLPQPYRMLDKLVAQVVEKAIELGLEKEKADKVYGVAEAKPRQSIKFGKECSCFAMTSDAKKVAAGLAGGQLALFDAEDGSELLSQSTDLGGEIEAIACYKSDNGEELFCVYAYGSLTLYKIVYVEKEVEADAQAPEGGADAAAAADKGAEEAKEEGPTTQVKTFPEFEQVSQTHIREPSAQVSRFVLTVSPSNRYISLSILDSESEMRFFEVQTEEQAVEEEGEEESAAEGNKEDSGDNASGGDSEGSQDTAASEKPVSYTHTLVEAGVFNKTSAKSIFEQTLSEVCYFWVSNVQGQDVGILVWDQGGDTLVFKQLCKTYVGSLTTMEGENSTWRLPFPISCVTFDPVSETLLIGSQKGVISLWNMFYIEHLSFLKKNCHPTAMKVVRRAGGSDHMLIACAASDYSMCVYDTASKQVVKRIYLSFLASNSYVACSPFSNFWCLHGHTTDSKELISILNLDECKPLGSDIVFDVSTRPQEERERECVKVSYTVNGNLCSVLTSRPEKPAKAEEEEGGGEESQDQTSEDAATTCSELALYTLNLDQPPQLAERTDVGAKKSLHEHSMVFKFLFSSTETENSIHPEDDFEKKKADIRRHLIHLDVQAASSLRA